MENTEDESNKTNEEIKDTSETGEQNSEAPGESSAIFQGINDEHSEEKHDQHFICSNDMHKMTEVCAHSCSKTISQTKGLPSVGQFSLHSTTASTKPEKEIDSEFSSPLVSRRTGKLLCDNFNQTSLVWERKPLAEILHPTTAKRPPASADTEKHMDAEDHVPPSAGDIENKQASFENSQSVKGEESKKDDQLSKEEELKFANQPKEGKDSIKSIATPGKYYYDPESSCPEGLKIKFDQLVEEKKPFPLQQTTAEEGGVWINQKTGKEVRSNFNQTSLIWEKIPLAEILQRSSTKKNTSDPDEAQSPED